MQKDLLLTFADYISAFPLIIYFGLTYYNYTLANKNNRNAAGVVACSLIISPLLVLIYLLIAGKK